ncbi:haloacid dehalogenase type II [Roseobacter sp. HKCCA0434]|uniref:haloacid dehalogenase type II n=1 Tax=Roseobacter sp. HKCCA0434 TaxID=3079297 RepID=UPI002905AD50|nr:haloacid dehalogenase type II [Roseobacter sp. HKCCA0434]
MTPRACLFDVFGTLTDWRSGIAKAVEDVLGWRVADPHRFADLWRAEYQPGMERVRAGGRDYASLDVLHLENLDRVLEAEHVVAEEQERHALNAAWSALPAWPDTGDVLAQIRRAVPCAPCSNGSIAMMIGIARANGLVWDAILGAELARNYKPQPEVYRASAAALGLEPGEVMMVAAHNDDLAAAREAGLMTGFFPRPTEHGPGQTRDLEPTDDWDIAEPDLATLASRISG